MLHALQKESDCSFLSFTGSRFQLSIEKVASYSALTMGFHFFENMSKIELQCLLNFEFPLQSVWKIFLPSSLSSLVSLFPCLSLSSLVSLSLSLFPRLSLSLPSSLSLSLGTNTYEEPGAFSVAHTCNSTLISCIHYNSSGMYIYI